MKKVLFLFGVSLVLSLVYSSYTYAENNFSKALRTCEKYSNDGSVMYNGEQFNLLITLNKASGNMCDYKEKIYQGKSYQTLNCSFTSAQLEFMANSMEKYNQTFKKQIMKNNIFEAKMSSNGEIFQKYLANPRICNITYSKKNQISGK